MKLVKPEKKSIGVEEIRALIDALSLRPYEGDRHIAMIEQADKMTPSAQNALLKTLENPPGEVMFFLITDAPGALLDTIRVPLPDGALLGRERGAVRRGAGWGGASSPGGRRCWRAFPRARWAGRWRSTATGNGWPCGSG